MERMEPCWRHPHGGHLRHHIPRHGVQGRQPLGTPGCLSLPLRDVRLLCGVNHLPHPAPTLEMEGAVAEMGSCRYLLAYRRLLLSPDADRPAPTKLSTVSCQLSTNHQLGMEPFHLRMDLCPCRHHHQLRQTQGAL